MASVNVKEIMESIKGSIDRVNTIKELNGVLDRIHPSDAHVVIRDMFTKKTNRIIQMGKENDTEEYQKFQDIKASAMRSFNHDRTNATMLDVDKAVSKSYGITLRMIREIMDQTDRRFNKVTRAINKMEEHLGLEVTNFEEDDNNDATEPNDVQGIEENTDRTGDTSTEV